MAKKGRIEVRIDHCKGCGLCIGSCKFEVLALTDASKTNFYGYQYLEMVNENCTGCTLCAVMCPDQAIDVFRE